MDVVAVSMPMEVIENILKFCDGHTLLAAEEVSAEWKSIVEYLDRKYALWKKACFSDIPATEFYTILDRCRIINDKWKTLFHNRYSLKKMIKNDYKIKMVNDDIIYSKCSGKYMVNITMDLILMVTEKQSLIDNVGPLTEQVCDMHFLNHVAKNEGFSHTHLMIQTTSKLLFYKLNPLVSIGNTKCLNKFAYFRDTLVVNSYAGRIDIFKMNFHSDEISFLKLVHSYVICADYVQSMGISSGIVYILADNSLHQTTFDSVVCMSTANPITFPTLQAKSIQIFYNHFIFVLIHNFLYISHTPSCTCKITKYLAFDCYENFKSYPNLVFLYGKLLALALENGTIFLYQVEDWSKFHVKNFHKKICTKLRDIYEIDCVEYDNEVHWTVLSEEGLTILT